MSYMGTIAGALIVIVSDAHDASTGCPDQKAIAAIKDSLKFFGAQVDGIVHTPAEEHELRNVLNTAVIGGADLVLTLGSVGLSPRDIVPAVTESILDDRFLGIEEAIRSSGLKQGNYPVALSRGLAGKSGSTIIINLVDEEFAIDDGLKVITPFLNYIYHDTAAIY